MLSTPAISLFFNFPAALITLKLSIRKLSKYTSLQEDKLPILVVELILKTLLKYLPNALTILKIISNIIIGFAGSLTVPGIDEHPFLIYTQFQTQVGLFLILFSTFANNLSKSFLILNLTRRLNM